MGLFLKRWPAVPTGWPVRAHMTSAKAGNPKGHGGSTRRVRSKRGRVLRWRWRFFTKTLSE